jgi:prophage regulatory protein
MTTDHTPINFLTLPPEGFVREPVVLAAGGMKRSTLWKWVAEGKFPKPYKISSRLTAWDVADVRRWINEKKRAASQPNEITQTA